MTLHAALSLDVGGATSAGHRIAYGRATVSVDRFADRAPAKGAHQLLATANDGIGALEREATCFDAGQGAVSTLEPRMAAAIVQPFQLDREGRLQDVQAFGCPREAAGMGNGSATAKVMEVARTRRALLPM